MHRTERVTTHGTKTGLGEDGWLGGWMHRDGVLYSRPIRVGSSLQLVFWSHAGNISQERFFFLQRNGTETDRIG